MRQFGRTAIGTGLVWILLSGIGCSPDAGDGLNPVQNETTSTPPDSNPNHSPNQGTVGRKAAVSPESGISGPQQAPLTFVDLQPFANVSQITLTGIEPGTVSLGGVEFAIGPGLVNIGSTVYPRYPAEVTGIPVGRAFRTAHILHATQGGSFQRPDHPKFEQDGTLVGHYVFHYNDGSHADVPLIFGEHLRDGWNWDSNKPTTRAAIVWEGETEKATRNGVNVRLYLLHQQNPHPEKTVTHLDFLSANAKAAPFCVAITLSNATVSTGYKGH